MDLNELLKVGPKADTIISLEEYLQNCASESLMRANAAGRALYGFGTPTIIDTSKDARLGVIFNNRTIKIYPHFADFYGLEEPMMKIGHFFDSASKGLVQDGLILHLLGPVGSGKSSLVERILNRFETVPMWVLGYKGEGQTQPIPSPIYESPLGLFNTKDHGDVLEEQFKLPRTCLIGRCSKWAADHLNRGGYKRLVAMKMYPSKALRIGIASVEPTDSIEAQRSSLVGLSGGQHNLGDYRYTGALNATTQGIMSFSEMCNAGFAQLNPLLSASVDRQYAGDGSVGTLPYGGVIITHSNEYSWQQLIEDESSENLRDRFYKVDIPYNVRLTEEAREYKQYLERSGLANVPQTPHVLELPALFAVRSRISTPNIRNLTSEGKVRSYDGDDHATGKNKHQRIATTDEMRADASWRDGMSGVPTRFMHILLTNAAARDLAEPGLDPVLMLEEAKEMMERATIPGIDKEETETALASTLERMREILDASIRRAYVENFEKYIDDKLEFYFLHADAYIEEETLVDTDTGLAKSREETDQELRKIEKAMEVVSPRDFRERVVSTILRRKSKGESCSAKLILSEEEWQQFVNAVTPSRAEMLPVVQIKHRDQGSKEAEEHKAFMTRLCKEGHTTRQARRAVEWYTNYKNWK